MLAEYLFLLVFQNFHSLVISTFKGKRKNLHQLISDKKLTLETREAQKAEKERLERLKKRTVQGEEGSGQIILEEDPQTKEIKVQVKGPVVYMWGQGVH